MEQEKTLVERLADSLLFSPPSVLESFVLGDCGIDLLSNGSFCYRVNGVKIRPFHAKARHTDGREVNTRTARYRGSKAESAHDALGEGLLVTSSFTCVTLASTSSPMVTDP